MGHVCFHIKVELSTDLHISFLSECFGRITNGLDIFPCRRERRFIGLCHLLQSRKLNGSVSRMSRLLLSIQCWPPTRWGCSSRELETAMIACGANDRIDRKPNRTRVQVELTRTRFLMRKSTSCSGPTDIFGFSLAFFLFSVSYTPVQHL